MNRRLLSRLFSQGVLLYLVAALHLVAAAAEEETGSPAEFAPIDLSRSITTVFSNAPPGNIWGNMPKGRQVIQGVPFNIDGKFEVTGMDALKGNNEFIPPRVGGIPIGRKAEKLVLLHATGWTEKDGRPMARLVLHYANGQERVLRIIYGVHVRNWYEDRYEKKKALADPNSSMAWSGSDDDSGSSSIRLYKTTFENPLPAEVIQSVDVVSLFSHSTPIIVALTLQNGGPEYKKLTATAPRHLLKKGMAQPDSLYSRTLKVRPISSESGTAPTNSTLFVTLNDDQNPYFFGAYKADAQGTVTFDYPPQQTVSLNLLVKSPGRAPLVVTPARDRDGEFPSEIVVKLDPGAQIGGVVNDDAGKPVAGAEILISSVTRAKTRVYTQLDFDQVRTDASGHWQSSSAAWFFEPRRALESSGIQGCGLPATNHERGGHQRHAQDQTQCHRC